MKTAELIKKLQKLDPKGTLEVTFIADHGQDVEYAGGVCIELHQEGNEGYTHEEDADGSETKVICIY